MKNITLDKLITIDEFSFEFVETIRKRVKAFICIGKNSFAVNLQLGTINDVDLVRVHLERIILEYELVGTLEFMSIFDRSVIVCLNSIDLGNNKSATRVTIKRIYEEEPLMSFYCRFEQVATSIYLSLLKHIQIEPDYDDENELEYYNSKFILKYRINEKSLKVPAILYNRLQSDVIEDYITRKVCKDIRILPKKSQVYSKRSLLEDYAYVEACYNVLDEKIINKIIPNTREFLKTAHSINYKKSNDLTPIHNKLHALSLKEGYKLKFYSIGDGNSLISPHKSTSLAGNFNSYVCVEDCRTGKMLYGNVSKYFDFEFNECSVWELYLIMIHSITFLPAGWHGCYEDHKIILGDPELLEISPEKDGGINKFDKKLLSLYMHNPIVCPSIKILSRNLAKIYITLFTKWGGLEQHHIIVSNTPDGIKFKELGKITLIPYDPGFLY